jgi:hypothetical protein
MPSWKKGYLKKKTETVKLRRALREKVPVLREVARLHRATSLKTEYIQRKNNPAIPPRLSPIAVVSPNLRAISG